MQNYYPPENILGEHKIEFLYNKELSVILVGQPTDDSYNHPVFDGYDNDELEDNLSPHEKLAIIINESEYPGIRLFVSESWEHKRLFAGGEFGRGENGEFETNEESGHFGLPMHGHVGNWEYYPDMRQSFKNFFKNKMGVEPNHTEH